MNGLKVTFFSEVLNMSVLITAVPGIKKPSLNLEED